MLSSLKINLIHCVISTFLLNIIFFSALLIFRNTLNLPLILLIYLSSFVVGNLYLFTVFLVEREKIFHQENLRISGNTLYKSILDNHFKYSKWIILGGIAFWGYSQGIFIFSKLLGAEDIAIGKIRTIQNLLGVTNILLVSVENLYTPLFSKFISENSRSELHYLVKNLYRNNYLKILFIAILAFLFATVMYEFLYYDKYGSGVWIIIFFTISQTILLAIRPMIISLKSIEVTRPFFYAHVIAVIVMLVTGYIFILNYQYEGMAIAFVLSNLAFSIVVIYFYRIELMKAKT
jgi:O-antigen/teichoic acid export membrane protein